jgi:cell division transport system permease protein
MKIRNSLYYVKQAAIGVWRNGWMTLASITVVVLTLLILGAFIAINLNIVQITEDIKNQVEVIAYLEDDAAAEDLRQQILDIEGIKQLSFVSKEKALERMREQLGEGITEALDERNPLPASFEIQAKDPDDIPALAEKIQELPGVESVDYGQQVVEKLFQFTRVLQLFGLGIIAALAIMALFLIANTIKLTVFARRRQINIMKFVGATDWFIRWPFILEGVFLGLLGALIAYLILFYGYGFFYLRASAWLYQNFLAVTMATPEQVGMELLKMLFALGVGIGAVGSGISVRKFLKV